MGMFVYKAETSRVTGTHPAGRGPFLFSESKNRRRSGVSSIKLGISLTK